MKKFFIFNGIDSRDLQLHIAEYPPVFRPQERTNAITIPGRSGTIHELEGESVYNSYYNPFVVTALNPQLIDKVINAYRGTGELIFGNDLDHAYDVDFSESIQFTRIFKEWKQATFNPEFQPFKKGRVKTINFTNMQSETEFEFEVDTEIQTPPIITIQRMPIAESDFSFEVYLYINKTGLSITLPFLNRHTAVIDMERAIVYEVVNDRVLKATYNPLKEFPIYLKKGMNKISGKYITNATLNYRGQYL